MKTSKITASMLLALTLCIGALGTGCSFHARDAADYQKVTRELVESKGADIKGCYDSALKQDPKVAGTVVVKFTVQKETGKIANAKVDETASSAPANLGQCIVNALEGLALDPPDARDGDATFQWEFQVKT